MANDQVPSISSDKRVAIEAFRKKLAAQAAGVAPGQRGRLIFGIDCTASREHCWEMASQLQVEMFQEAAKTGGVEIQLATYRGSEFETSTPGAARELAELLRATAAYAAGGRQALLANKTTAATKLLLQLPPR